MNISETLIRNIDRLAMVGMIVSEIGLVGIALYYRWKYLESVENPVCPPCPPCPKPFPEPVKEPILVEPPFQMEGITGVVYDEIRR